MDRRTLTRIDAGAEGGSPPTTELAHYPFLEAVSVAVADKLSREHAARVDRLRKGVTFFLTVITMVGGGSLFVWLNDKVEADARAQLERMFEQREDDFVRLPLMRLDIENAAALADELAAKTDLPVDEADGLNVQLRRLGRTMQELEDRLAEGDEDLDRDTVEELSGDLADAYATIAAKYRRSARYGILMSLHEAFPAAASYDSEHAFHVAHALGMRLLSQRDARLWKEGGPSYEESTEFEAILKKLRDTDPGVALAWTMLLASMDGTDPRERRILGARAEVLEEHRLKRLLFVLAEAHTDGRHRDAYAGAALRVLRMLEEDCPEGVLGPSICGSAVVRQIMRRGPSLGREAAPRAAPDGEATAFEVSAATAGDPASGAFREKIVNEPGLTNGEALP